MPFLLSVTQETAIRDTANGFYFRMAGTYAPEVRFDLRGRAAGQWRMRSGVEILRFNAEAFLKDWDTHFPATVAHEVAHSLVFRRCSPAKVRPHGPEWQDVMRELGFPPTVTHQTPLTARRSRRYVYRCGCREHQLGPRRHYLASRRGYRYSCMQCGEPLHFHGQARWDDR